MTLAGILQFSLLLLVSMFSFVTNRDIFSPVKWYLLVLLIFFAEILWKPYSLTIHLTYTCLILFGAIAASIELRLNRIYLTRIDNNKWYIRNPTKIALLLWAFSIPSIMAQLYMISHFGGDLFPGPGCLAEAMEFKFLYE